MLKPEHMSMVGLNLFTQLSCLTRLANASLDNPLPEDAVSYHLALSFTWFEILQL